MSYRKPLGALAAVVSSVALAVAMGFVGVPAAAAAAHAKQPVKLIFDTDFGGDVDDAGAIGMLNAMQDNGEVKLLAMIASNPTRHAAPGMDAINTYYGHPNIPMGSLHPVYDHVPSPPTPGAVITGNNVSGYAELLARGWKQDTRDGSRATDAVDLYRRILAKQKNGSVTIAVTGGQLNVAQLLNSGADRHSRLTGRELVERKVKELVIMGAAFPSGHEWNIMLDPAGAKTVADSWPTPVYYSGFEVGDTILTGSRLFTETEPDNPVLNAYEDYVGWGNDRNSWDITAAYYAVRGGDGLFGLSNPGNVEIKPDGSNEFHADPNATRRYLVPAVADEEIADEIEDLMVQPPARGPHKGWRTRG